MVCEGSALQTEESELPGGCLFKSWTPGGDHGGFNGWPCWVISCFGTHFSFWGREGGSVGLAAVMGSGDRGGSAWAGWLDAQNSDGHSTDWMLCPLLPPFICWSRNPQCHGVGRLRWLEPLNGIIEKTSVSSLVPPCADMAAYRPGSCTHLTPNLPMSILGLLSL